MKPNDPAPPASDGLEPNRPSAPADGSRPRVSFGALCWLGLAAGALASGMCWFFAAHPDYRIILFVGSGRSLLAVLIVIVFVSVLLVLSLLWVVPPLRRKGGGRFWGRIIRVTTLVAFLVSIPLTIAFLGGGWIRTKTVASGNACVANLKQIDGAVQQWALENRKKSGDTVTPRDVAQYLKFGILPVCPDGGTYFVATVGSEPICSLIVGEGEKTAAHRISSSNGLKQTLEKLEPDLRRALTEAHKSWKSKAKEFNPKTGQVSALSLGIAVAAFLAFLRRWRREQARETRHEHP